MLFRIIKSGCGARFPGGAPRGNKFTTGFFSWVRESLVLGVREAVWNDLERKFTVGRVKECGRVHDESGEVNRL